MTQRELALYETVKILLNQLISSELIDYKQTREVLKARAAMFESNGYGDAAAMMTTLGMAIEPKRQHTLSPDSLTGPDLSHAIVIEA